MKHYIVEVYEDKERMSGEPCIYGTRILLSSLAARGLRKFKKDYPTTRKYRGWRDAIFESITEKRKKKRGEYNEI